MIFALSELKKRLIYVGIHASKGDNSKAATILYGRNTERTHYVTDS